LFHSSRKFFRTTVFERLNLEVNIFDQIVVLFNSCPENSSKKR
jgi:hypothetical protein